MKKLTTFLCLILLGADMMAQRWTPLKRQQPQAPKVALLASSEQGSTIQFTLDGFYQEAVTTPHGPQQVITMPKMASMLEEGAPDLPLFAIPMMIGDRDEMTVKVEKAEYQDFEGVEIAPSKGNLSRQIDPDDVPFRYGEAYGNDAFYPGFQARLEKPYILRDVRGQNIMVYPFAYNPASKTLRVYTRLVLTMSKTGEKGANSKLARKAGQAKMSRETEAMYRGRFVNYEKTAAKYTFIPDEGEMLVICPPAYLEAMQPFVDWKNQSGRPTTMANLADIGNNPDQVKAFILSHYNNPEENLCYVLLVGDYADLSPKMMSGGGSDIWFGQLEGTDYYPEVFVGRFSVESVADVQNQVAKVIYYERDITAETDWLDNGIGIGSSEGAGSGHNGGESDYQHIEYIRDTLLHYTYSEVSQHYHGVGVGTNAAMLRADFNAGASICNYCNHGSQTGWFVGNFNNSQINTLTNDYKWPVIWSTACLNGQFNYSQPCFAEVWMRATNSVTGAPTGAIGGMFSWTSQPWQPPMTGQDEMVDILCEWRNADQYHHTLGGASLNGNMKILDLHPSDQGETHNTWILFGDPSLTMRTANPTNLNLVCQPEAIFLGQTELNLTADADYALATLSVGGNVISCVPVLNGECSLTFEALEEVGSATLVVTSFNKVTDVRNIDVIPANGAYLTYNSFTIDDANGQADYGETVNLSLTMRNIGNEPANNVQVVLGCDAPEIEIINGTAVIPNIEAMNDFTISGFQIAINDHVVDGRQVNFTVTCTKGSQTWTSQFRMTLHAPSFALAEFRTLSTVNPGETGQLLVGIKNVGSAEAREAQLQLYSSSSNLDFGQALQSLGDIPAGNIATTVATFTTTSQLPTNSSIEVLYLFDAQGYPLEGVELLNIGSVKETFETGDFSAFDWQTLGGSDWFVDNSTANTGTYSARSGAITHANLTTLQVQMDVAEDGEISFFKKTSTEASKDRLTFYIDNTAMGEWSGEVDWSRETFEVAAGTHKFKWIYYKDSSGSYGDDCCWIDDVQFPSASVFTFLPALEVESQVVENEVTLTWQANNPNDSYVIRRNGIPVATQQETTFRQLLNLGTYTYSVTAVDSDGRQSLPAFATVEISTLGVDSIESELRIFPNPVRTWLNICFDYPFQYALFNNIGQQIWSGKSMGDLQIDCGTLSKGVYLLKVDINGQVIVKKIVVTP